MPALSKTELNLILVRHGLTDWNEQGRLIGRMAIGLNERGRAQAGRAAEALRDHTVEAVISSPQRRTRETAEPIAQVLGLDVEIDPGLDEVWLGRWQGKTVAELHGDPDLERTVKDPTYICDAIEPAARVRARAVAVVERLRSKKEQGLVVLVSHGDPLRFVLVHYLSMDLGSHRRLEVDNGAISVLRFSARGPRLTVLNWRGGAQLPL